MTTINQNNVIIDQDENSNRFSFWKSLEFYQLQPRLNRTKHLGLFSFWFGSLILLAGAGAFIQLPNFVDIISKCLFVLLLPNLLALKIRRLHDFNYSAWWVLLLLIPVLGIIWALAIFCIPGTKGNNKFGEEIFFEGRYYYFMILTLPAVCALLYLMKY